MNKVKNPNAKHYEIWHDFETIDIIKNVLIKDEYIGFLKGNILKYQLRLGKKDDVEKEKIKIKDYQNELNQILQIKEILEMRNECLDLINTKIENKGNKSLTENLKQWRKDRNITKADYLIFVGNVLEELLEPIYLKEEIPDLKNTILQDYFGNSILPTKEIDYLDAIQDIQVFCINETELMGYDNLKCNDEVFKHINCRKQDPMQFLEWRESGPSGKWKKWEEQPKEELYEPNYESCKYKVKND